MVEVVNMYKGRCYPPWGQPGDMLIDRRSVFGNPFPIGNCIVNGKPENYSRDGCIQRYRQYFNNGEVVSVVDGSGRMSGNSVRNGSPVWDANLARQHFPELLKANRLGCWCKPQACHGDLLKAAIDQSFGTPPVANYTPPVEKKKLSLKDFGISSQTTLKSGSYINEKGDLVKTYKRKKKTIKPKTKRCRCKK